MPMQLYPLPPSIRRLLLALLCAVTCTLLCAAPPAVETAAKAPAPMLRSEFKDDPALGKDPFFPNSERRKVTNQVAAVETSAPAAKLRLQGISGAAEKRLAIINNRTFGVGEEAEMRVDGKALKVRCMEIRELSVLLLVNNHSQELTLGARY